MRQLSIKMANLNFSIMHGNIVHYQNNNGNYIKSPTVFCFSDHANVMNSHSCFSEGFEMYKAKNAHAEILFCEVDLLFGHVIVAVS